MNDDKKDDKPKREANPTSHPEPNRPAPPPTPRRRNDANGLLTEADAAEYLSLPPSTLKAWRTRGGGPPFIRINGRLVRYRQTALDAWLDTQTVVAS